jgi:hypothetical protein
MWDTVILAMAKRPTANQRDRLMARRRGLRAAGRKAVAEGQTTAHRSRPALSAWHTSSPSGLGHSAGSDSARGDMRTEVLTCAMQPDFAVNVICYGYGGD